MMFRHSRRIGAGAFSAVGMLAALAAGSTHAQESPPTESSNGIGIPLTGRIFSDIYVPTQNLSTQGYHQVSTSLWLQGDPRLSDKTSARLLLQIDGIDSSNTLTGIGSAAPAGGEIRTVVREGFVAYVNNGWEFRAGRQILPWGKSDVVNPTDYLTAKDYTFFNPDEEVRRLGATSLLLSWTPDAGNSPLYFTGVIAPVFPQSRLLIPTTAIPAGIAFTPSAQRATNTLSNSEAALKAGYNASSWDFSLSGYHGWNHFPQFTLNGATLGQTFYRTSAAGGDLSFAQGNWVFRGESAYYWTPNNDGLNPRIMPAHWDSVVGAERPIGDDFRIQGQFLYRYVSRFNGPALEADPVAAANALLLNYQFQHRPGYTLRFGYSNESTGWEAELFSLGYFKGGDYLLRPKASYAWSDAFRTTLGLDYYSGPKNLSLGALNEFNSLFFEAKYVF